jgi:hypothetical protein
MKVFLMNIIKKNITFIGLIAMALIGFYSQILPMEQSYSQTAQQPPMLRYQHHSYLSDGQHLGWLYIPQVNDWALINLGLNTYPNFNPQTSQANFFYANPDVPTAKNPHGLYFWASQYAQPIIGNNNLRTAVKPAPGNQHADVIYNDQSQQYGFMYNGNYYYWDASKYAEHGYLLQSFPWNAQPVNTQPVVQQAQPVFVPQQPIITAAITQPEVPTYQASNAHEVPDAIHSTHTVTINGKQKTINVVNLSAHVALQQGSTCPAHSLKNNKAIYDWVTKMITQEQRNQNLLQQVPAIAENQNLHEDELRDKAKNQGITGSTLSCFGQTKNMINDLNDTRRMLTDELKGLVNFIDGIHSGTQTTRMFCLGSMTEYNNKRRTGPKVIGYNGHWVGIVARADASDSITLYFTDSMQNDYHLKEMVNYIVTIMQQDPGKLILNQIQEEVCVLAKAQSQEEGLQALHSVMDIINTFDLLNNKYKKLLYTKCNTSDESILDIIRTRATFLQNIDNNNKDFIADIIRPLSTLPRNNAAILHQSITSQPTHRITCISCQKNIAKNDGLNTEAGIICVSCLQEQENTITKEQKSQFAQSIRQNKKSMEKQKIIQKYNTKK